MSQTNVKTTVGLADHVDLFESEHSVPMVVAHVVGYVVGCISFISKFGVEVYCFSQQICPYNMAMGRILGPGTTTSGATPIVPGTSWDTVGLGSEAAAEE